MTEKSPEEFIYKKNRLEILSTPSFYAKFFQTVYKDMTGDF